MKDSTAHAALGDAFPALGEPASQEVPPEFIEIVELRQASIEHRLGYFGQGSFVVFGYCPGGGEVIWKDGRSSGFGTGGWRVFLYEIGPTAARCGASIGSIDAIGTHVLVMDRVRGRVYAAPRDVAQAFLARANHLPAPRRRCLCAMLDCASCPVRSCPLAGVAAGAESSWVAAKKGVQGGQRAGPTRQRG